MNTLNRPGRNGLPLNRQASEAVKQLPDYADRENAEHPGGSYWNEFHSCPTDYPV
jgi:hypothetical protein